MKVSSEVLVKTSSTHSARLQQLAVSEGKNGSRLIKIKSFADRLLTQIEDIQ